MPPPSKKVRSDQERLALLEDHLWLLLGALASVIGGSEVHYKQLAAELRVLVADRTKHGLTLLRDAVGRFKTSPWNNTGETSSATATERFESDFDSAIVLVSHGRSLSRTELCKLTAEQDGSAHEGDALDLKLVAARETFFDGNNYLTGQLIVTARLALKWGLRTLDVASKLEAYVRRYAWDQGLLDLAILGTAPRRRGIERGFVSESIELPLEGTHALWYSAARLSEAPTQLIRQTGSSSSLSLELDAEARLRAVVDLQGTALQCHSESLRPGMVRDWNHLAIAWRADPQGIAIYLNGEKVADSHAPPVSQG